MSAAVAVSLRKVGKTFARGEVTALQEIDLDVQSGAFISLIGPSGCGKSTLLRIAGDLIQPSSGEVVVNGNLATPAWEISDVEIKKGDRTITITLWSTLTTEAPGIQVLEPFSRTVPVKDLSPGTWTIEVVGHGGTGDKVQVRVQ